MNRRDARFDSRGPRYRASASCTSSSRFGVVARSRRFGHEVHGWGTSPCTFRRGEFPSGNEP